MASRSELQTLLESLLGSKNVYYQPPENLKMHYPAFVYKRDNLLTTHANDKPYLLNTRYAVIAIYTDPESPLPKKIALLKGSNFLRSYTKDGLYHDVFNIYF